MIENVRMKNDPSGWSFFISHSSSIVILNVVKDLNTSTVPFQFFHFVQNDNVGILHSSLFFI